MVVVNEMVSSAPQVDLVQLRSSAKELLLDGNVNAYLSKVFELERLSYSLARRLQA